MNPISANVSAIRNIMTLDARAPRSEYWWVVATLAGGITLTVIINVIFFPFGGQGSVIQSWLRFIFILFVLIWILALFSVSVRRLHDVNRTGLWVTLYLFVGPLAFLVISYFCSKAGTVGPSRYGPDPKMLDES